MTSAPPPSTMPNMAGAPPPPAFEYPAGAYPPTQPPPAFEYPAGAYPPTQPPPYPVMQGQTSSQTTVIVQQPQSLVLPGSTCRYGQYPALIVCQHCQATVTTSIDYETGLLTWSIAGLICLTGLILGCCLIPFCINATKDVEHRCPNCKNVVGKFRHFG